MGEAQLAARPAPQRRAAFVLLGCLQVTVIAAITMLTVSLPGIQRDLRATDAALVLISAAYSLSFGALLMLGGRLSDVVGARAVLLGGLGVFGLTSAVGAVAPTWPVLVAARAGQGIGAALVAPAAISLVLVVVSDPVARPAVLARWGMLSALGASVGVAVFGAIGTWVSWRWLFAAPVVVSAVAAACTPGLLPAPAPARRAPGGWLAGGFGALLLMVVLVGVQISPWSLPAGGVLLGCFVLCEQRASRALVSLARGSLLALISVLVASGAMATMFFVLSLQLQGQRHFTSLQTSATFLLAVPGVLLSGSVARQVIPRFGSRRALIAGLGLAAAGAALLGSVTWHPLSPWAGMLVFPLGAGLALAAATVAATRQVPAGRAGAVGALLNTAMELGPALGLAVLPAAGNALATGSGDVAGDTLDLAAALLTAVALAVTAAAVVGRVRSAGSTSTPTQP